jgi:hypothetical protein
MEGGASAIVFVAYGVAIEVVVHEPRLIESVERLLPPGSERTDAAPVTARFELGPGGRFSADGVVAFDGVGDATVLAAFDNAVRSAVAVNAPDHVFVHAGVVARDGRAIVLPGASGTGKTTLVVALVRAGATYFSDEFAVLDPEGRVHPYPKTLSLREPGAVTQVELPAGELGAVASAPAEVGAIALTTYTGLGGGFRPGTAGAGALALLSHAIAARSRSAAVLEAVRAAATDAVYVEGPRGEADAAAQELLALIDEPAATPRRRPERPVPLSPGG